MTGFTKSVVPRSGWKILWICLVLMQIVGCRGCRQQKPLEDADAEIKKKKQRLVADELKALPFGSDTTINLVKPGHWYQANNKLKANFQDESLSVALTTFNRERKPTPFFPGTAPMEFQRDLSLARGQEKNISLKFYQPEVSSTNQADDNDPSFTAPSVVGTLYSVRGTGTPVLQEEFPFKLLSGYQYNIVTISADPARYAFWRGLDCIVWPSRVRLAEERYAPHRIIDLKEDEVAVHFPNRLYTMTSVSHIVINDASPAIFNSEQQQSIIDWLHFGGTIIINGTDAVGGVDGSFLKEYSPLKNTRTVDWSSNETEAMNRSWTIKQVLAERVPFAPDKTIPRLDGELNDNSQWLDNLSGIVAERMVGQGRVVMTTFPMTDSAFLRWPSYSSFVHNAILRKPYRDVTSLPEADTTYAGDFAGTEQNPLHSTRLRLWARDLDTTMARRRVGEKEEAAAGDRAASFPGSKRSSLGAWNSQSDILLNARQSLQESSGITVPRINTIIKLLAGYLIVLVPINWLVFRLIGRVELAWVAAPLIAIVGAFVVARSVQLDVGFSRSQTNCGFLECHANYPRGVLSNYTALYTSLSTNYQATFDNETGVVAPLPAYTSESGSKKRSNISKWEYTYADNEGAGLQSNPVLSNTTGMLQSEEVVSMQGTIAAKFSDDQSEVTITRDADFPLQDVGILGIDREGRLVTGWLGSPNRGEAVTCALEASETDNRWLKQWDRKPHLARPNFVRSDGSRWTEQVLGNDLYLGAMLEVLAEGYPLGRGEYIAIGWTEKPLSALQVRPVAKQLKQQTIVLLHLKAADLPTARPDTRIFARAEKDDPAD